MQPDQTLDERAARALGWQPTEMPTHRGSELHWINSPYLPIPVSRWHPSTSHDDAHVLVAECERRGVLGDVASSLYLNAAGGCIGQLLLATPADITRACCEALEAAGEAAPTSSKLNPDGA